MRNEHRKDSSQTRHRGQGDRLVVVNGGRHFRLAGKLRMGHRSESSTAINSSIVRQPMQSIAFPGRCSASIKKCISPTAS